MPDFKIFITLLFLLITVSFAAEKKMVGYYNLVRELSDAQNIQYDKFTHINIENVVVDSHGELQICGYDWAAEKVKMIVDTIKARSKAHGVKVSIVLGYDNNTMNYITDPIQRSDLAHQLVYYCVDNEYDGIDLDFEGRYDGVAYELLTKEIHELLPSNKLLTAAVGSDTVCWNNPTAWTDEMLSYCDWVNVMIYCIRGTWPTSPIGSPANFNDFVKSATVWNKRLPKEKLVLGLPTFSATFTDPGTSWEMNGKNFGVRRIWGIYEWSQNSIDYRYILKYFPEDLRSDTVAGGFNMTLADIGLTTEEKLQEFNVDVCGAFADEPPLNSTDMLGKTFFSGPKLTRKKAEWAANNGYAGLMINHLHEDVTKATDYIDTLLLDSISLISNAFDGLYNSTPIETEAIKKRYIKPILVLKNKMLYFNKPFTSITLYSPAGRKIISLKKNSQNTFIELPTNLSANIYIAKVRDIDNAIFVDKFLVGQ